MKRFMLLAAVVLAAVGCGQSTTSTGSNGPSTAGKKLVLATEPAGAKNVLEARANAKDAEEIVVVGRIGGDPNPWSKGLAGFMIVDLSAKACSDIPGDTCKTPWDYCCEADLGTKTLAVRFNDAAGKQIETDAKELLGVKELDTVVVHGKAKRDDKNNLVLLADGLFVKK